MGADIGDRSPNNTPTDTQGNRIRKGFSQILLTVCRKILIHASFVILEG